MGKLVRYVFKFSLVYIGFVIGSGTFIFEFWIVRFEENFRGVFFFSIFVDRIVRWEFFISYGRGFVLRRVGFF